MSSESLEVVVDSLLPSLTYPQFTNYTLTNLYTDESLTNIFDISSDLVTEDLDLYARWESADDTAVHFAKHLLTF